MWFASDFSRPFGGLLQQMLSDLPETINYLHIAASDYIVQISPQVVWGRNGALAQMVQEQ